MNPPSTFQMVEFITTKLLHVVVVVVIPLMYMSLSSLVSLYWHAYNVHACDCFTGGIAYNL